MEAKQIERGKVRFESVESRKREAKEQKAGETK